MHLLVLSAFRPSWETGGIRRKTKSQCTFWCSVLSDWQSRITPTGFTSCLNAPSGAQCFPTDLRWTTGTTRPGLNAPSGAQCFPTKPAAWAALEAVRLNAPSGAQCFPTQFVRVGWTDEFCVSMHLLVLSAFRHWASAAVRNKDRCLNAPSGAQCFPTRLKIGMIHLVPVGEGLNAPSGAQCFPTES